MKSPKIIEVALPNRVADSFDYLADPKEERTATPGTRVLVEFGSRKLIGMVVRAKQSSAFPLDRIKPILRVVDAEPILPGNILSLMQRGARYYHHPLGDVIFTGIPRLLREGKGLERAETKLWFPHPEASALLAKIKRAPKQCAVLQLLLDNPLGLPTRRIAALIPQPQAALKALHQKRLILSQNSVPPPVIPAPEQTETQPPTPNSEQKQAIETLQAQLASFNVHLLDGITGSGKTEVYLNLIAPIIEAGQQVLILVPEISLTPQLQQRFAARFPHGVASLHSGMNDTERLIAWRQAGSGAASIVLGTRSAVFTPMPRLGYIIIDEEHDPSLKQNEGFRYHARNLAIFRGQLENCPVLLGSATPSLETLANVARGRFGCVRLQTRAGEATPPQMHLVDLRRQQVAAGLSRTLIEKMHQHLDAGNQVLLFLNRRGYAPAMLCHECGYLVDCPRCDAHMTYHIHQNALHCHHCGHLSRPPTHCPDCGRNALQPVGVGTQKIEDVISECFAGYSSIRIDRDSMSRKHALENALEEIRQQKHQIIIGTQMLAKGHDFHAITLVGMIDVDQGLFSSDFHAPERLVQQVLQVSGRAGRGNQAGEVVIQTLQPEHPLLHSLLTQNYATIAATLLSEREIAQWPPYRFIALFRASAHQAEDAKTCLHTIKQLAQQQGWEEVELLGPAPAPMERRAGRFRFQLLLRSASRTRLHQCLSAMMPEIKHLKVSRKARWSLDVDPLDLT